MLTQPRHVLAVPDLERSAAWYCDVLGFAAHAARRHRRAARRGRGPGRAEFIKPLRTEPWGMRVFRIRTVDGHRMMCGQPLA